VKKTTLFLGVLCGAFVASCGSVQEVKVQGAAVQQRDADDDEDDGDDENEEVISLDQVPELVQKAAIAAVPGFVPSGAEKETEEGALHYCVHGKVGGEFVEVEVTTDGQVLEIEHGEDDED